MTYPGTNFPTSVDTLNTLGPGGPSEQTQNTQGETHQGIHAQLAAAIMAIENAIIGGGGISAPGLGQSARNAGSGAVSITTADRGKAVYLQGAGTVTFAASLGLGFVVAITNIATVDITINNSPGIIYVPWSGGIAFTSLTLHPGESVILMNLTANAQAVFACIGGSGHNVETAFGQYVRATSGGAITIAQDDRGKQIMNNGGNGIVTLPALSVIGPGFTVALTEIGGTNLTVNRTAPDVIYRSASASSATSITVKPKETVLLMADTVGGQWVVIAGSGSNVQPLADIPTVVPLVDGANIATNAAAGNEFTVTIAGSRTLSAPTNPSNGQKCIWRIKQGGAGSNTITFDTVFRFGSTVTSPTLSTAVGAVDYIGAIYDSTDLKWDVVSVALGYGP